LTAKVTGDIVTSETLVSLVPKERKKERKHT